MPPTIAVLPAEITCELIKLPTGQQIAVELSTPKPRTIVFIKQGAETFVHAVCSSEAEAQAIAEALEREWSGGQLPERQLQ